MRPGRFTYKYATNPRQVRNTLHSCCGGLSASSCVLVARRVGDAVKSSRISRNKPRDDVIESGGRLLLAMSTLLKRRSEVLGSGVGGVRND